MSSNSIKQKQKNVLHKVKTERYSYKNNIFKNNTNNKKQIIKSSKQFLNKQTISKSKQRKKRSSHSNHYSQSVKVIKDNSKINSKNQSQKINQIKNKFTNFPNIPKDDKFKLKVSKQKGQISKYDKLINLKRNQPHLNHKKKYSYQQKLNPKSNSINTNNELTQRQYENQINDIKINLQSTNFQNYQVAKLKQTDKQNLIHQIIHQINKLNHLKQNKLTNQTKRKRIQSCKFVRNPFDTKKIKTKKILKPQLIDLQHKLTSQQFLKELQIQQISSIFQLPQFQNIPPNSQSIEILNILNQQNSFIA